MKREYILIAALALSGCAAVPAPESAGPVACIPAAPTVAKRPESPILAALSASLSAPSAGKHEALVLSLKQCVGYALTLEALTKKEQ